MKLTVWAVQQSIHCCSGLPAWHSHRSLPYTHHHMRNRKRDTFPLALSLFDTFVNVVEIQYLQGLQNFSKSRKGVQFLLLIHIYSSSGVSAKRVAKEWKMVHRFSLLTVMHMLPATLSLPVTVNRTSSLKDVSATDGAGWNEFERMLGYRLHPRSIGARPATNISKAKTFYIAKEMR